MKILKALHDFEFTASGGIAIYFLMCAVYVTIAGIVGIVGWFK